MSFIFPYPWSNVNDKFGDNSIDFSIPINSFINPLIQGMPNQMTTRWTDDFYQSIGVDIVSETVFDYPYNFITEKTYRSIAMKRPMIIVGPYNTLAFLRFHGFITFSSIIDESYDTIKDPTLRWHTVCNSIEQFVTQPISKIREDVASISDILNHNCKNLINLESIQLQKIELILNSI